MTNVKGQLVVSLDLELFWGVFDHETIESYGGNILGGRAAIPQILEIFKKYDIHATWATVGMLFADKKSELIKYFPELVPEYENEKLSAYKHLQGIGETENDDSYHYGSKLISMIQACNGQEIGSHTFSHYYCKENGQTREAFVEDLKSARRIADATGIKLKSLVLPRNQFTKESVSAAKECGFIAIRGNPPGAAYDTNKNIFARIVRKIDSYFGIIRKSYKSSTLLQDGIVDVKASCFLYPYNKKLSFLEKLKVSCIKRQMRFAAKKGCVFHLWWHPHNMGKNTKKNLDQLEEIFKEYKKLQQQYGFESVNMDECAKGVLNENSITLQ